MKPQAAKSPKAERKGRSGRPSREDAERIEELILDAARDLFFRDGYGATSIENIARTTGISKRTFYARYKNKAEIFRAVVHKVLKDVRPSNAENIFEGDDLEEILQKLAAAILQALLTKPMIALHRLLLAEAPRFPELVSVVFQEGARAETIQRVAGLLKRDAKAKKYNLENPEFVAEQFLFMVSSIPQRRAMGLGKPLAPKDHEDWTKRTVALFLDGLRGGKN